MSNTPERDAQLLDVGHQCSQPTCSLVDFLPLKCHHCSHKFCGEHFSVDNHNCPSYDESKHNRVAPNCPLCNKPVAIPPGENPNVHVDRHISNECKSGKSAPVCARGKCGKVLFSPISCKGCSQLFCPTHRFAKDHSCSSLSSSSSKTAPALAKPSFSTASKASSAGTFAINAVKKTLPSKSLISTPPSPNKPTVTIPKITLPNNLTNNTMFSKTDRPSVSINSASHTGSSNISSRTENLMLNNRCAPNNIINGNSFIPPPIFATA